MWHRIWSVGLLGLLLVGWLSCPAEAAIKLIVDAGLPFFCKTLEVPDPNGTQVCIRLELYPFTLDARALTEHGARTVLVASTSCTSIKTLLINRAFVEYAVVLVAEEILVRGCPR